VAPVAQGARRENTEVFDRRATPRHGMPRRPNAGAFMRWVLASLGEPVPQDADRSPRPHVVVAARGVTVNRTKHMHPERRANLHRPGGIRDAARGRRRVVRARYAPSGFDVTGTLPAGTFNIVAFARSTTTAGFEGVRVVHVTVR